MITSKDERYWQLQELDISLSETADNAVEYMVRNLRISENVARRSVEEGNVGYNEKRGTLVFPIFDLIGNVISAEEKTTSGRTYLCSSLGEFGYTWAVGSTVRSICYFTNTLDVLAFADYYTNIDTTKPLKDVLLVALHGSQRTKPILTYSNHYNIARSTICVHNNELGHKCMPEMPHFFPHTKNGMTAKTWYELLMKCKGFA